MGRKSDDDVGIGGVCRGVDACPGAGFKASSGGSPGPAIRSIKPIGFHSDMVKEASIIKPLQATRRSGFQASDLLGRQGIDRALSRQPYQRLGDILLVVEIHLRLEKLFNNLENGCRDIAGVDPLVNLAPQKDTAVGRAFYFPIRPRIVGKLIFPMDKPCAVSMASDAKADDGIDVGATDSGDGFRKAICNDWPLALGDLNRLCEPH